MLENLVFYWQNYPWVFYLFFALAGGAILANGLINYNASRQKNNRIVPRDYQEMAWQKWALEHGLDYAEPLGAPELERSWQQVNSSLRSPRDLLEGVRAFARIKSSLYANPIPALAEAGLNGQIISNRTGHGVISGRFEGVALLLSRYRVPLGKYSMLLTEIHLKLALPAGGFARDEFSMSAERQTAFDRLQRDGGRLRAKITAVGSHAVVTLKDLQTSQDLDAAFTWLKDLIALTSFNAGQVSADD